jgi:hypothetical protein
VVIDLSELVERILPVGFSDGTGMERVAGLEQPVGLEQQFRLLLMASHHTLLIIFKN